MLPGLRGRGGWGLSYEERLERLGLFSLGKTEVAEEI